MNILATGETSRIEELKQKLSSVHVLTVLDKQTITKAKLQDFDLIFDLNFDDDPNLDLYHDFKGKAVFVSAVKIQLAALPVSKMNTMLAGINALPTFLSRSLAEVSLADPTAENKLKELCASLTWSYRLIQDRVGMVMPRLVFMIINEAFFTVQEGTATENDIDLGMKLGTNYPMGPFEWCSKLGIHNVYETLDALYLDTRDERYKICPALKTAYLRSRIRST